MKIHRTRHVTYAGIPVVIQAERGQKHEGHRVAAPYGFVAGTNHQGADDMAVDVFLGPHRTSERAFIVDCTDAAGKFKQVKTLLGFPTTRAAEDAFRRTYGRDPDHHIGGVTSMSLDTFKSWLNAGGGKHPVHPDVPMASDAEQQDHAYAEGGAVEDDDTLPASGPNSLHEDFFKRNLETFFPGADHAALDREGWADAMHKAYGGAVSTSSSA